MKIIFIDFDDVKNPLLGAGQARATLEVGSRLAKKGHQIEVITSRYPGSLDRKESGIFYKHIGLGTNNIRINNVFFILSIPFVVPFLKGDLIIECFTAPISTLFSPLLTKIPVVGFSTSFEASRFSQLYKLPFDKVEKFGLKFYKYFIALTDHFEQKITTINPKVISTVIPEGVDSDFLKIVKHKPKFVLFIGRYDMSQKGIDLLLQSYAKIRNDAKYPLVLVGRGPDKKKILKMVKDLNLQNSVSVNGAAYGHDKVKYLSEAIYVALPSRNETFSCFALEALAAKLPIVAFDIPGLSWATEAVAIKAKQFDIDEYARLLLSSMKPSKMSAMGKNARIFASKFTWNRVANDFDRFAQKVINIEKLKHEK